jgi:hypothetical protein
MERPSRQRHLQLSGPVEQLQAHRRRLFRRRNDRFIQRHRGGSLPSATIGRALGSSGEARHDRSALTRTEDGSLGEVPMVRILLPPADSLSLSRSRFRRSRTRLSARVWAAGLAIGSAETLGFFDIAPIGGNISVGPNSSTAVRLMWWRDCHAGPNEVGPSLTYGRSLNPDWAQAKPSTIR